MRPIERASFGSQLVERLYSPAHFQTMLPSDSAFPLQVPWPFSPLSFPVPPIRVQVFLPLSGLRYFRVKDQTIVFRFILRPSACQSS